MTSKKFNTSGIIPTKLDLLFYFCTHLGWVKYIKLWRSTIKDSNSSMKLKLPWITFGAIDWLDKLIHNKMRLFEFGSGGSTIFLAKRCKEIISIEHDSEWYKYMINEINSLKLKNVDIKLIPPDTSDSNKEYSYKSYTSITFDIFRNKSFEKYVRSIEEYPDESFDMVSIDGRSRASCIYASIKKIMSGGYLLLDNSERAIYQPSIKELLSNWKRIDFFGFGPGLKEFWTTTIWEKP